MLFPCLNEPLELIPKLMMHVLGLDQHPLVCHGKWMM